MPGGSPSIERLPGRGPIVGAFLLHALVTTSIGARMPAIRDQTGLDAPALGVALGAYALSLLIGTRVGGRAVTRFGDSQVLRIGIPVLCLSVIPVGLADGFWALTLPLIWLGLLSGAMDVAMNSYGVGLEQRMARPILSGLHGAWSGGFLISAALGFLAVSAAVGPGGHLATVGLAGAVAAPLVLARLVPLAPMPGVAAGTERVDWRVMLLPTLMLGLIGFGSFVAEGAVMDWGQIYLTDVGGAAVEVATIAYLANAVGMFVSRLVGDRLVLITGPVRLVQVSGLALGVGLMLIILFPEPEIGFVVYLVMGFAAGPAFPTALSAAGAQRGSATIVGWVVTMAYLGSVVGPMVIGLAAGSVGLQAAFIIPMLMGYLMVLLAPQVRDAARSRRPATTSAAELPPL